MGLPTDVQREATLSRFEARYGRRPDVDHPRRFTDKVLHRIFFDDDPLHRLYADKVTAPYFARAKAGTDLDLAERLGLYRRVTVDDLLALPDQFILKGSHSSNIRAIVSDKAAVDLEAICDDLNRRASTKANARGEPDPEAVIIAEELLTHADGRIPDDYKFHCFPQPDGQIRWLLNVHHDRFNASVRTIYGDDLQPLPFEWRGKGNQMTPFEPPPRFDLMVDLALRIAADFDYIRVDFYNLEGRIVFGEVTPFPFGGIIEIDPPEWDYRIGDLWTRTAADVRHRLP